MASGVGSAPNSTAKSGTAYVGNERVMVLKKKRLTRWEYRTGSGAPQGIFYGLICKGLKACGSKKILNGNCVGFSRIWSGN